jgi:Fur family ferric uptake transcriptional regulator
MPRKTRQRQALVDALATTPGFASARALHKQLEEAGHAVSLATVYRNLQALAEAGAVDVVIPAGTEAVYRACHAAEHHHHVVCRRCGAAEEVTEGDVEAWAERVARAAGFTQVRHTLEITGLCPACSRHEAGGQGYRP